jgi:hypothetical protein
MQVARLSTYTVDGIIAGLVRSIVGISALIAEPRSAASQNAAPRVSP